MQGGRQGGQQGRQRGGLVRGFISVGLWTFLSRISGFVRDILMAAWLGTISYEVICSPSKRVPRVYIHE